MRIAWHKYHVLRNDFIVIDSNQLRNKSQRRMEALALCDRHAGVGADGVLFLFPKGKNMVVDVYNADGSWAEISGNGARIAAFHMKRVLNRKQLGIFMGGRAVQVDLELRTGVTALATVDVGSPAFELARIPMKARKRAWIQLPISIGGKNVSLTAMSVGNPHAVLFVESFDFDWQALGKAIENHHVFPNRTNVEFVRVRSSKQLEVRLWERGVGETGSSGTGAAASLVASVVTGRAKRSATVTCPAGSQTVVWDIDTNTVRVRGPVNFVAAGLFELP
jgi:diaminopimelate epimerase